MSIQLAVEETGVVEAFDDFVRRTGTPLYRSALLLCGEHHLAEDLTQLTYAKLYAAWSRVSRADNPDAYAQTTLARTYLSHRRVRRNSEVPAAHTPDATAPDADPTTRLDLLAALQELHPRDRAVLVLRFFDDLAIEEIADRLHLSQAAVRKRIQRALTRMRHHFPDLEDLS